MKGCSKYLSLSVTPIQSFRTGYRNSRLNPNWSHDGKTKGFHNPTIIGIKKLTNVFISITILFISLSILLYKLLRHTKGYIQFKWVILDNYSQITLFHNLLKSVTGTKFSLKSKSMTACQDFNLCQHNMNSSLQIRLKPTNLTFF